MWPLYIWLSDRIICPELTVIFLNCFLQVALQGWALTRKHTVHRLCTLKISSKRHQGKNPSIYEGKFNFPFMYFYFSCNQCRTLKIGSILVAMHDVLKGIRRFIALLVMLILKTSNHLEWQNNYQSCLFFKYRYIHTARQRKWVQTAMGFFVGVSLWGQYEHLHTILQKPFLSIFIGLCLSLGVGQREHTMALTSRTQTSGLQNDQRRTRFLSSLRTSWRMSSTSATPDNFTFIFYFLFLKWSLPKFRVYKFWYL